MLYSCAVLASLKLSFDLINLNYDCKFKEILIEILKLDGLLHINLRKSITFSRKAKHLEYSVQNKNIYNRSLLS